MKKLLWLIASAACINLLFMSNAYAISNAAEVKIVAQRVEALRVAMIDANEKILRELSASQLSYGHSGGHIENQDEFIEKLVSGRSDFITMELQDQTISVIKDAAIVRHTVVAKTKDKEAIKDIKIGVMLIWQKQNRTWKLLARQAFKMPTETH